MKTRIMVKPNFGWDVEYFLNEIGDYLTYMVKEDGWWNVKAEYKGFKMSTSQKELIEAFQMIEEKVDARRDSLGEFDEIKAKNAAIENGKYNTDEDTDEYIIE